MTYASSSPRGAVAEQVLLGEQCPKCRRVHLARSRVDDFDAFVAAAPTGFRILPEHGYTSAREMRFTLDRVLPRGERVRWTVINEGDEAKASRDLGRTHEGRDTITWEATKYRGDKRMRCELLRSGEVVASCERVVRIR